MENHFMEYNDILNKINEVLAKIDVLRDTMTSIKGISYGELPKGKGQSDSMIYYLAEIEELELGLIALKEKKNILRKEHELEISKVSNDKYRSVLRMFYLDKFDVRKIADTLDRSTSWVAHTKRKAIDEFILINCVK